MKGKSLNSKKNESSVHKSKINNDIKQDNSKKVNNSKKTDNSNKVDEGIKQDNIKKSSEDIKKVDKSNEKSFNTRLSIVLKYLARTIAIFIIIFIGLFAFDEPFCSLAFFIHLVPSLIMIGILIPSWASRSYGCLSFFVLFVISIIFYETHNDIYGFLLVSFPLLVISGLFGVSYNLDKNI